VTVEFNEGVDVDTAASDVERRPGGGLLRLSRYH
jgi:hypothetical protein